ncbi:galactosyltransferase-related protein [Candidatus Laterigemmans baculatus]|uniref:galactosyltransferase-related protein n=1 Tax=Candidatus Laterigemmans baculatus TaxID=2770505 RepID=UPI0013DA1730|nr:galactosyltransferase-related protein [Candidatus Laterigemmans baculatus]
MSLGVPLVGEQSSAATSAILYNADSVVHALRNAGEADRANRLRAMVQIKLPPSDIPDDLRSGVGRTLSDSVAWLNPNAPNCLCRDFVATMNRWGTEKCRENVGRLAKWMIKIAKGKAAITEVEAAGRILSAIEKHESDRTAAGQAWPFVWTYWADGAVGDELRYSIRSVLKYQPGARVVVVGDKPGWYTGDFISKPRIRKRDHHAFKACYSKLIAAATELDRFVWMMDDVYWIKQFEMEEANCICYTTPDEAKALIRRDPRKPVSGKTYRRNRKHIPPYGGIWVIRKSLFLEAGGMDEAFIEWGWQDVAFHSAIVSAGKDRLRLPGPMFHLWHETNRGHRLRRFNEQYFHRYYKHVPQ